ncbi:MAG: non-homologous end-joining DNA ligase [Candidatus Pseudobacter hemicellulosilyticus]|uniref:DNA ligase (ATP) n=1 Tax=Candidatus Pseudobacter hemicellulosilyticus TaxID=3121375 RepID=A0AAJ5WLV6_9BACT|nr:MAG: non-homologous end-joining DNA ligase [Pseudobacter sp.]
MAPLKSKTGLKKFDTAARHTRFYKPMLATLGGLPFDDPDWLFEMKWDGYRAVADWSKGKLKLYSRNGISFIDKYPIIAEALTRLKHDCVLDGEIVVMDEKGRPRFQLLQHYAEDPRWPIAYYIFDILFLKGQDLKDLPLLQRKELLQQLLKPYKNDLLRYSDHIATKGKKFFKQVMKLDFEGMVAKKADSSYHIGFRSNEWVKIKHHNTVEAVIAGFTEPRRSRKYFGALILGQYKGRELQYMGHTGTGFTQQGLKELWQQLQPLVVSRSPFAGKVKVNAPVTWVQPKLVCNIKFTEQTNEGLLRHPVFMGLRMDKKPDEVTNTD